MCKRANQFLRGLAGQLCVGIERNYVAHVLQQREIADFDGERIVLGSEKAVEVEQFPALSFPAHPHALRGAVDLVTMEMEEASPRLWRILATQSFDQLRTETNQGVFVRGAIA